MIRDCSLGNLSGLLDWLDAEWPSVDESAAGVIALFTDEAWGGTLRSFLEKMADDDRCKRLLELRAFDEGKELHAVRDAMGKPFRWRVADDAMGDGQADCLDDTQYLDIDARGTGGYHYQSMNGGSYELPVANADRIVMRNYLAYSEDGLAYVADYRIVRLLEKGD